MTIAIIEVPSGGWIDPGTEKEYHLVEADSCCISTNKPTTSADSAAAYAAAQDPSWTANPNFPA